MASPGYIFANAGLQGSYGAQDDQHPVTRVSWRDAVVWCNAASEKQGLTPVYYADAGCTTPMRTASATASLQITALGDPDKPCVNWSANGHRLPTEAEWEYAAQYIDGDAFMRGNVPSGWQDSNTNNTLDAAEVDAVAWWSNNSGNSTHPVAKLAPNALGIFDMGGNVWEWTWDWNSISYSLVSPYTDADSKGAAGGTERVGRGGSWFENTNFLTTAVRSGSSPWLQSAVIGFRPVRRP